ncbi:gliding motility-associated C-terminal domain-containing protein [Longitalea luteola]|uniref:T9SS type B sorting domain-containing protein n=1 Tax=Longitalea luteola TaxID=2812563 RepID=UPI001A9663A7|nr:gliding motility-associated C-terminal domain-containing protein [Longitalea luteola]
MSGSSCVGSQLRLNSTIVPDSITWIYAGNKVAGQKAILNDTGTTVAGGNRQGARADQLSHPDRIYVDAAGVIYIPDTDNNRVQKWLPGASSGTTVAGGNGAGNAPDQFDRPTSVCLDAQGNIYVADQNNNRVQKFAPGATQGVTVAGANGELRAPTDLFIDAGGSLYVSDQLNNVIRKYAPGSPNGVVVAGNFSAGTGPANLDGPSGIYVDAAGNIYICDTNNKRVQKWGPGASTGTTVAVVSFTSGFPLDVSVDCKGDVYTLDYALGVVIKNMGVNEIPVIGREGYGFGVNRLYFPIGIFISENNIMYIADSENHRVQKFTYKISPVFTPNVPGNYTVIAHYKCCPDVSLPFTVELGKKAAIEITATATSICPGEQVTFTATNPNQLLNPKYQWKLNGVDVSANSNTYQPAVLQENDHVQCIMMSTGVCDLPDRNASNIIRIEYTAPVPLDLEPQVFICPDGNTTLRATATYNNYVWQDKSTQPQLTVSAPGKYYVTAEDKCGRSFSDTVLVSLFAPDNHILPVDTIICSYENLQLKPIKECLSFLWSDHSTNPSITINQPGLYWLQAKDMNGCTVRDSLNLLTKTCPPRGIYMPNAFTPDNNGKNDILKPVIYGKIKKYQFRVFNRYGQMVFNTSNPAQGWDGRVNTNLPNAGVYVWSCSFELEGAKPVIEKGTVVLIK